MVSAYRQVGTQQTTVEDIHAPVEPGNPFWLPLWDDLDERTLRKIGPKATKGQLSKQEPPAQVAYLAGDVDGVPWECVVQTDRVKTAPRKYERGWARIIALTCGIDIRTAAEKGRKPQDDVDLKRITYAANRALKVLEQRRRYSDRLHDQPQMRGEPDIPIVDLPRDEQVLEVARVYNAAVGQGIRDMRGHVMAATGLTEATTRRRIQAAQEQGLIPKETK
jgi:hypothetical protein